MSVSDKFGDLDEACPKCNGTIHYYYYAPDCRYNDPSEGAHCKSCGWKTMKLPIEVKTRIK